MVGPMNQFRIRFVSWTIFLTITLLACKPSQITSSVEGVSLTYYKASEQSILFDLRNNTAHAVRFSGWNMDDAHGAPMPVQASLTCYARTASRATTEHSPLLDGVEAKTFVVPPQEQLRISFPISNFGELRGDRCYLDLKIDAGRSKRSAEFELK